jgi:LemA protein
MEAWVFWAVVVLLVLIVIGMYNRLVRLKNQVAMGWRQIDVQLKRRHDLIPNLVNTVRGAMEFERETLERVVQARSAAMAARGPADAAAKEGALSEALSKLFVVLEQYPQLRATENVRALQEELSHTENQIGFARQFYNDIVTQFNIALEVFPTNILAGLFAFRPATLFQITEAGERAVPQVDLRLR